MTLFAVTGMAQGFDATEAAIFATDQALAQTGRHRISLAIIASSHDYPVDQIVNGVAGLLSDTPMLGFSTPAQITSQGVHQRSIVVALIVGDQVHAESGWWESSNDDDADGLRLTKLVTPEHKGMLIVADSLSERMLEHLQHITSDTCLLGGCISGGEMSADDTYQIGGRSFGSKGIAAAALSGNLSIGMGTSHGWQQLGMYSRITQSNDLIIETLDGRRACEAYAEIFGFPAREWTYPPLNRLVRLYPFGIEEDNDGESGNAPLCIRAPRRIEVDGSLRMDGNIEQGQTAHLMISSVDNCITAARKAAEKALNSLGEAKPVLAVVFADIAWQMQLEAQPGAEVGAIQDVIGAEVPIVGGYTFGQLAADPGDCPELLNQHIQVILIGDPGEDQE